MKGRVFTLIATFLILVVPLSVMSAPGGGGKPPKTIDADTLQGHPASDFAPATHTHPVSTDADTLDGFDSSDFATSTEIKTTLPGTFLVPPGFFQSAQTANGGVDHSGFEVEVWAGSGPAIAYAPLLMPFKCRIIGVDFRVEDSMDSDAFITIELLKHDDTTETSLASATTLDPQNDTPGLITFQAFLSEVYDPSANTVYYFKTRFYWKSLQSGDWGLRWIRVYYEPI